MQMTHNRSKYIAGLMLSGLALSGCVSNTAQSDTPTTIGTSVKAIKPVVTSPDRIGQPIHKISSQKPHTLKYTGFTSLVNRLQSLGYLPITHAFIHTEKDGHFIRIRHDAFLWNVPSQLQHAVDQYAWNANNPFIRAAVIQFERQNGILGPKGVSEGHLHKNVIKKLFSDSAKKNAYSYQWVYVTKGSGTNQLEQLHVWQHGTATVPHSFGKIQAGTTVKNSWVWGTVVNTGVLGATPDGTWPVYQRLPHTDMRGTFPVPISTTQYNALAGSTVPQWAGSSLRQSARGVVGGHYVTWQPYNDPDILWVNYFDDGRGIHYYPRASYGFPQSAGCVEQPYNSAPVTYHLLQYGDPVTISSAAFPVNADTIER